MDYFDQIDEYLNNSLSESDTIAFENAMANDLKLKQAVDDHKVAMDVVGSILESEVRKVIDNEEEIINSEQLIVNNGEEGIENGKLKIENGGVLNGERGIDKGAKVRKMNWMRWVAAAAVVFVMGWWGMGEFNKNDTSKLYASTYSEPTWPIERGDESTDVSKSILKYFNNSKEDGKDGLKTTANSEANYWLAEIYYKEMKFDSTLLYLPKEVAIDKNRRDRINYLKILSLYFEGDKSGAKEAYSDLPSDTDIYYRQFYSKLSF